MNPGNLLVVAFLLSLLTFAKARIEPAEGDWTPIEITDLHVYSIAKFAVSEYNSKSQTHLSLEKVVKGETQIVSGKNYRFILSVQDEVSTKKGELYEAVVWEKLDGTLQLTSFVKLLENNNNKNKNLSAANVGTSNAVISEDAWTPIENVNDPHVIAVAEFAVAEHNMQAKSNLKFEHVVNGEIQIVSGKNYRLHVKVSYGPIFLKKIYGLYETVVLEKPWIPSMTLTSFTGPVS